MNPVVMLRIIQTNPSQTKTSKEGLSHPGQITRLHNHNSHHLRKAAKSAPSSMDQQSTKKRVPRGRPSRATVTSHKDQPLQHLQLRLEDHHRLPQSPNQVQASRIHWNAMTPMDPPKHPQMARAQVATKSKKASTTADAATWPSNTIICSCCGESGHWSKNCPHNNLFCDFCRVTTHATHMCRATGHGPGSPVCIYCGKSNHSSANCRYRPKDNWEEPRQTPDALRTGATSKNSASASRNQTGPAPHTTNHNPFSHIDVRGQNNQHYGGPQRSHHREPNSATPRGEQSNNNQNFPPRRQQHAYFDEGYNRRYSPPMFPSPTFNNTTTSNTVGRSIIQLAENQSHSLDFILVGQQSQMDAYREMTCSNQA